MIDIKDYNNEPVPGVPVTAIFIDGDGKVVAVTKIGPEAKISGLTSQLGQAAGPADADQPVIEVSADITLNPPASSGSPLRYTTAVRYCHDKFGNRVPCPPRF